LQFDKQTIFQGSCIIRLGCIALEALVLIMLHTACYSDIIKNTLLKHFADLFPGVSQMQQDHHALHSVTAV
jgi:hypothetical protein